ncbi:MAG: hypothetical protein H7X99_01605 [Saprospiraceae bacterium]|nr:hypothetical protein [Saprospiraceae bacterium]
MQHDIRNYRCAIYPKDIAMITGKSIKSAWMLNNKIKKHLGKVRHQILTVGEFCEYMGIPEEEVLRSLNL